VKIDLKALRAHGKMYMVSEWEGGNAFGISLFLCEMVSWNRCMYVGYGQNGDKSKRRQTKTARAQSKRI